LPRQKLGVRKETPCVFGGLGLRRHDGQRPGVVRSRGALEGIDVCLLMEPLSARDLSDQVIRGPIKA